MSKVSDNYFYYLTTLTPQLLKYKKNNVKRSFCCHSNGTA